MRQMHYARSWAAILASTKNNLQEWRRLILPKAARLLRMFSPIDTPPRQSRECLGTVRTGIRAKGISEPCIKNNSTSGYSWP